ncbi:MAG: SBBP repeat-containing protein, partial [Acidobacteria bacterium]|nr:SBBP repeat-containing protein [Acidobacteriota bacterium]
MQGSTKWSALGLALAVGMSWSSYGSPAVVGLPSWFEPDPAAAGSYVHRGDGYEVRLEKQAAVRLVSSVGGEVRMVLLGADGQVRPMAERPFAGRSNYLLGGDPRGWRRDVPHYGAVRYGSVYPGVDLLFYGGKDDLEFDFIVAPGAKASAIRLKVEGAASARLDAAGDLLLAAGGSEWRHRKPVLYQEGRAGRLAVEGRFTDLGQGVFGIETGPYDRTRALVIDPVLFYKEIGGAGPDVGKATAIDGQGNIYILGGTSSADFPASSGALQKATGGGAADLFLIKLNSKGDLVYSTYLGGNGTEGAGALALDQSGNVYLTGSSSSTNYPTTADALQKSYGGGTDAILTKIDAAGSQLLYSSYLGGTAAEVGNGLALDAQGNVYVAGWSASAGLKTSAVGGSPAQAVFGGGANDAFVAKFSFSPAALVYATFLGGSGTDEANALAVEEKTGIVTVAGFTTSANFPATSNAPQRTLKGVRDGFAARLNAAGTAFSYATYLGGAADDNITALALNAQGSAYVGGTTTSTDFPTTPGTMQASNAGKTDVFITRLSAAGQIELSSYLGGANDDSISSITVRDDGSLTIAAVLTNDVQAESVAGAKDGARAAGERNSLGDPYTVIVNSAADLSRVIAETKFAPSSIPLGNQKMNGCKDLGGMTCCTGSVYLASDPPTKRRCAVLCLGNSQVLTTDIPPGNPNYRGDRGYYGDPVSTETGEITTQATDLKARGPARLGLTRSYASLLKARGFTGALGPNWMHGYEMKLAVSSTGATVTLLGGKTVKFKLSGGAYVLDGASPLVYQLIQAGTGYKFMQPLARMILTFNEAGQLTAMEDRNGNTVTIEQSAAGPVTASDGLGRTLRFSYSGGRLSQVQDETGRTVAYGYSGEELASVTDAAGGVTNYSYAARGNRGTLLAAATLPAGNQPQTQEFDDQGRATSQRDPNNNSTSAAFGSDGSATITGPLGESYVHTHQNGRLTKSVDPAGEVSTFAYDANQRQTSYTDRMGQTRQASYHAATGFPESFTDASGRTVRYSYTAQSQGGFTFYNLTGVQYADGSTTAMTFDDRGNLLTLTDGAGQKWSYTYNTRGQVLTAMNPAGGMVTLTYTASGDRASSKDPAGNVTSFSYDDKKRLKRIAYADGTYFDLTLDQSDRIVGVANQDGLALQASFDANGRLVSTTSEEGGIRSFAYDASERVAAGSDRLGKTSTYEYDAAGRVVAVVSPTGRRITAVRDAMGRVVSTGDAYGVLLTRSYDKEGRVTSATDGMGRTWNYSRDELGRLTGMAGPTGSSYQMTYDARSRLSSFTDAAGRKSSLSYDRRGSLAAAALSSGESLKYTPGALGMPVERTDPNGSVWKSAYTPAGRISSQTDPLNRVTAYEYDSRNRLSKVKFPEGQETLSYDGGGRLQKREFSDGLSLEYGWSKNGKLTAAPGATFAYDAAGRLTNSNGLGIARDDEGRIASITYAPGKTVAYEYNARGLLARVSDWGGGEIKFSYDDSGLLTGAVRSNGVNSTYGYDGAAVLTSIAEAGAAPLGSISLTRDAAGQILSADRNLPTAPEVSGLGAEWTYDDASRIGGAGYDKQGNLVSEGGRTFSWNLAGRLTGASGPAGAMSYSYDGMKMLTGVSGGGRARSYVVNYGLDLPSIAAAREGDADQVYYVYTPGGRLLYSVSPAGDGRRFYHFDEAGNTTFLTDDTGAVTDSYGITPFGEAVTHAGTTENPFTFQGSFGVLHDAQAGLFFMRNRLYDGRTARFLSPDPLADPGEPRGASPYQYALLNPLSRNDPTGLLTPSETSKLLQYAVAARTFSSIIANDIGRLLARSGYGGIGGAAVRGLENQIDALLQQLMGSSQLAIDYGGRQDVFSMLGTVLHNNADWLAFQMVGSNVQDAGYLRDAFSSIIGVDAELHGSDGGRVVDGGSRTITAGFTDQVIAWARGRNPLPPGQGAQVSGAGSAGPGTLSPGLAGLPAFAGLLTSDGAGLLTSDGAGLLTSDGAGLLTSDGAGLLTSDGAGLLTSDGAGLLTSDGAGLLTSDGA